MLASLALLLATRAAASSAGVGEEPCPATPCPRGSVGKTWCSSAVGPDNKTLPGQCNQPTHLPCPPCRPKPGENASAIKISCVGDSITQGQNILHKFS